MRTPTERRPAPFRPVGLFTGAHRWPSRRCGRRAVDPRSHVFLDVMMGMALIAVPGLAGFDGVAARVCVTAGVLHLSITMLSGHPASLAGVMPMRAHAFSELLIAAGLAAAPWLLGLDAGGLSRPFMTSMGLLMAVLWAFTRYADFGDHTEMPGARFRSS